MSNQIARVKTVIPSSLAGLPSFSKTLISNGDPIIDLTQISSLIGKRQTLDSKIVEERLQLGAGLSSSRLLQLIEQNNYGDCIHIATAVNKLLQENSSDLSSIMPNGIVVLMRRGRYYNLMANFVSAPFFYGNRVKNMDEKTLQSFRAGIPMQASPAHVFNVLNLPQNLKETLDRKGKVFLSPDFRELGENGLIIDPWLTDELVFPSSEANNRYQSSFNTSYPIVMLLKPDHPINSVCLL